MKDNLFEMLLDLFETSLTQIQKSHNSGDENSQEEMDEDELLADEEDSIYIKSAQEYSTRVLTYDEQMKLTKASYQFMMRMKLLGVIDADVFESTLNQLYSSDSRIVTLQETKWTIRNILSNTLNEKQLAFLDLILFQAEDALALH